MIDLSDLMSPLSVSFKRFSLNSSVGNAKIIANEIWQWSDKYYKKASEDIALNRHQVKCALGCNYCCYQNVAVNVFEAIAIADWIRSNLDECQQQYIYMQAEKINANLINDKLDSQRWERRVRCPCLDDASGGCLIHESRPMECRNGISASVEDCRSIFENNESQQMAVELPYEHLVQIPPVDFPYNSLSEYVHGCLVFSSADFWHKKFTKNMRSSANIISPDLMEVISKILQMELSKVLIFIFEGSVDDNLKALVRVNDIALDACAKHTD